jgi:RNA polymerase sigma-70 factor (ECF subfamily)
MGSEASARIDLRDPAEFRAFYRNALPRVYGYLLSRCGVVAVAEDLAQEAFVAAVAELKRGTGVQEPMGWIIGIARHKLLDHFRRQAREERALSHAYEADPVDDEALEWDEETSRERALAALASLAPAQRAAMTLRYLEGMSVPEVAAVLRRSVHATESLLARGREGFKRDYVEARDG